MTEMVSNNPSDADGAEFDWLNAGDTRKNGDRITGRSCAQCGSERVVQTASAAGGGTYATEVKCETCGATGTISGQATDVRGDVHIGEVFD